MSVEYQNKSEVKVTANATSIIIPVPTGFSAGDLLIAIVIKDDDPAIVLPTGGTWTLIQGGTGGDPQCYFSVSYRIAVAGDTSWTWTGDSEQWYGVILRYTGQASSGFIHASGKADGDSATPTAPSVGYTDLEAGSIALHCFGQDYDRIPYISPVGVLEKYNDEAGGCGGAGGEKVTIIDSYSEDNQDEGYNIANPTIAISQSFTATGNKLKVARFYLQKAGSPTGNIVAKLYSHTGTYGTSSEPDTLLATSDVRSLADMPTTYALVTFTFSGANIYELVNGTKYCIVIESTDCELPNYIWVGRDDSSPTHSGNPAEYTTSWTTSSTRDLIFYVQYNEISGTSSTGTAIFTTDAADEWLAVTVVIEAAMAGEAIKKVIDEILNISELKNYFRGRYKITNEVVDVVESKNYLRTLTRIINETLNISELYNKLQTKLRVVSEVLNVDEAKNYIRGRLRIISETLNISELKNAVRGIVRIISEVINIGELYNKVRGVVKVYSEIINVSELKNYIRNRFKIISEVVNISESKNKLRSLVRIVNETINIAENIIKIILAGLIKVINETVNIGETIIKTIYGEIVKVIDEVLNISELKNYTRDRFKVISEVVNISELKNKLRSLLRAINEIVNVEEAKNYIRGRLQIVSEILNVSELKNYIRGRLKVINESINISELYNRLKGIFKIISEVVNVGELQNKIRGFVKVVSETLNISELKNKIKGFIKVINEAININEFKKYIIRIWTAVSKISSIWTPQDKDDRTWTPEDKRDTSWTEE